MKIKFKNDVILQRITFLKDEVLEENEDVRIEELNDKYVMLIINGLRYDLSKDDITIIEA